MMTLMCRGYSIIMSARSVSFSFSGLLAVVLKLPSNWSAAKKVSKASSLVYAIRVESLSTVVDAVVVAVEVT